MGKNLAGKTAFIVAVLVIFCFGIVGIPHGGLKQSITNRIQLGLDLKGGTHLVLEVHVDEAVASATDRDVQRLEDDFQKAGIAGATVGQDRSGASGDDCRLGSSGGEAERCAFGAAGQRLHELRRGDDWRTAVRR